MKHQHIKELIHLSFLDELTDDERQVLEKHIQSCQDCQAEHAELDRMHRLVAGQKNVEVTDELLREARRELRVALRLEQMKRSKWAELLERINILSHPTVRYAFAAAAVLVIGIGLGYLMFVPSLPVSHFVDTASTEGVASQRGDTRVSNLRFVRQGPEKGEVEFSFEMVTPIRMKGNVNDNAVQRVLAQALLNDQNPGARLLMVSTLANQVESTRLPDVEIKAALIRAVRSDANVGVRQEALKALQKFPLDGEIKQAIIYVLRYETNPSMRIDAINYLEKPFLAAKTADQDILEALKEKMQSDENNYIRIRARNVYEEVKQQ